MEETKIDKSKVTVRVPKRLWKGNSAEYLDWQEFKFRTRLMPNGYRVTLACVKKEQCLYFGASACSPHDFFEPKSAYPRALGRARQLAFLANLPDHKLMPTLLNDGGEPFYYLSVADPEEVKLKQMRSTADGLYAIACSNAEAKALDVELEEISRRYGNRYEIEATRKL